MILCDSFDKSGSVRHKLTEWKQRLLVPWWDWRLQEEREGFWRELVMGELDVGARQTDRRLDGELGGARPVSNGHQLEIEIVGC